MKKVAEMTDLEIAEKLMWIAAEFDSDSDDEYDADVLSWLAEAKRRLPTHPAQPIADLTGQWITQNGFGSWLLWDFGVEPVFLEQAQTWASHSRDHHPYHIIDLPTPMRIQRHRLIIPPLYIPTYL